MVAAGLPRPDKVFCVSAAKASNVRPIAEVRCCAPAKVGVCAERGKGGRQVVHRSGSIFFLGKQSIGRKGRKQENLTSGVFQPIVRVRLLVLTAEQKVTPLCRCGSGYPGGPPDPWQRGHLEG